MKPSIGLVLSMVVLPLLAASSFSANKPKALFLGNRNYDKQNRKGGIFPSRSSRQHDVVLSVTSTPPPDIEVDEMVFVAADSIVNSSIALAAVNDVNNNTLTGGNWRRRTNNYNWREFLPKGTGLDGYWKKFVGSLRVPPARPISYKMMSKQHKIFNCWHDS